ncbi:hypothetical protein DFH09DRAFT_1271217 [Mycena vulgaris]|nr:hypothetical protein DFH09DRAFT_1271217 [Mycena vulgaris]
MTLPPLPFSNMLPEMLQHPTGDFTPQIPAVGDTFNLNNFFINWAISAACDERNKTQPVQTFSYYNNLFSDGCDVDYHCRGTPRTPCHPLYLDFGEKFDLEITAAALSSEVTLRPLFPVVQDDPVIAFIGTVQPCCDCGAATVDHSAELPTQAPCRLRPAHFNVVESYFGSEHPNNSVLGCSLETGRNMAPFSGDDAYSVALNTIFLNTFQGEHLLPPGGPYGQYLPPRPPIVLHPDVARFDEMTFPPPATISNLRETVHTAIFASRRDMRCSAIDCARSLQSAGREFMRCGRCRVVSCQRFNGNRPRPMFSKFRPYRNHGPSLQVTPSDLSARQPEMDHEYEGKRYQLVEGS